MKLKKLFKVCDKDIIIRVFDRQGSTSAPMTIDEFKEQYGYQKGLLKRKVLYIDVTPDNELIIDI